MIVPIAVLTVFLCRLAVPTRAQRQAAKLDWSGFLDSWDLFGTSYGTGLLVAALLGLCGVMVVAQRQVFVGVAIAYVISLFQKRERS